MKNIRVIQTGIDVSRIKDQLEMWPNDWGKQMEMAHAEILDPNTNLVSARVLQLVVGATTSPDQDARDTEICIPTPACGHHTEILRWAWSTFGDFARCAFLGLPVGKIVGTHVDIGNYYLTKDRYHLSIQGRYRYTVGDESVVVEPGTFLWFNNKLPHGTENLGDIERITFVIDVPHSQYNP